MSQKTHKLIRQWVSKYKIYSKQEVNRVKHTMQSLEGTDRLKFIEAMKKSV